MKATDLLSSLPSGWQTVPVKAACYFTVSNVDKHSLEDEIPVRLCNYTDVYKNDRVSPDLELMSATATEDEIEKFHLEVGDVVITKDSESWDDIGIPAYVEATADDFVCGYQLRSNWNWKQLESQDMVCRKEPLAMHISLYHRSKLSA